MTTTKLTLPVSWWIRDETTSVDSTSTEDVSAYLRTNNYCGLEYGRKLAKSLGGKEVFAQQGDYRVKYEFHTTREDGRKSTLFWSWGLLPIDPKTTPRKNGQYEREYAWDVVQFG